jgi:thiol-disulfide isomerase/thioredoxin
MRTLVAGRWSLVAGFRNGMIAFGIASAIAATPSHVRAQDLGIEVGSVAPSAKVHGLDGKEADLAQYIGKTPTVIEFWATWCPNCKELEPTMHAVAKKYGSQVKFVGVAVSVNETPERVKAYVAKYDLPGDHYFDTKGNATGAYDVPATSYVVVINKAGKVVYTGLGGKQNLDAAIKKAL